MKCKTAGHGHIFGLAVEGFKPNTLLTELGHRKNIERMLPVMVNAPRILKCSVTGILGQTTFKMLWLEKWRTCTTTSTKLCFVFSYIPVSKHLQISVDSAMIHFHNWQQFWPGKAHPPITKQTPVLKPCEHHKVFKWTDIWNHICCSWCTIRLITITNTSCFLPTPSTSFNEFQGQLVWIQFLSP